MEQIYIFISLENRSRLDFYPDLVAFILLKNL